MRTASWVSALVLIAACTSTAHQDRAASAPLAMSAHTESGRTRLELRRGGTDLGAVLLNRDATVETDAEANAVDVIADVPGVAVAVADQYPSSPGALSFCQAGDERFLRVLSLAAGKAAETLTVKVASCRDNLELSDPAIEWIAGQSLLRIHWLTGPNGAPEMRIFHVDAKGNVNTVSAP
jgi:hypothetical protein